MYPAALHSTALVMCMLTPQHTQPQTAVHLLKHTLACLWVSRERDGEKKLDSGFSYVVGARERAGLL